MKTRIIQISIKVAFVLLFAAFLVALVVFSPAGDDIDSDTGVEILQ